MIVIIIIINITELTELTAVGKGGGLGGVNINRKIFQGDSTSPLYFIVALIPLILVLR